MNNTLRFSGAKQVIAEFTKKYWSIWLTAIVVLIGWLTNQAFVSIAVLAVMAGVIFALYDESVHALSPLWMFYYAFSTSNIDLTGKAVYLVSLAAPVIGVVVHCIRFRPKIFIRSNLCKGFTIALMFAGLGIAVGGISMPDRNPVVVLILVALGVLLPLGYIFISGTIKQSAGKALVDYIAMLIFAVGILLIIQTAVYYGTLGGLDKIKESIIYKSLHIGWGGSNNLSPTLAISIPVVLCYSLKKSKFSWAFLLLVVLDYIIILTSSCRGTLIITLFALPFMLVYVFIKTENRLQFLITMGLSAVALIVVAIIYKEKLAELFQLMRSLKLDDNGREPLYRAAWENFLNKPIFGVGFDYNLGGYKHNGYTPFWYHSTPLQILSCMGIVGFIIYAVFYYHRYRCFFIMRKMPLVLAIGVGLLFYDAYSWIDVNFFPPNSFIIMMIMTMAAEKYLTKEKALPHSVKIAYYVKGEQIDVFFRKKLSFKRKKDTN